jgi:hypothetical protein
MHEMADMAVLNTEIARFAQTVARFGNRGGKFLEFVQRCRQSLRQEFCTDFDDIQQLVDLFTHRVAHEFVEPIHNHSGYVYVQFCKWIYADMCIGKLRFCAKKSTLGGHNTRPAMFGGPEIRIHIDTGSSIYEIPVGHTSLVTYSGSHACCVYAYSAFRVRSPVFVN